MNFYLILHNIRSLYNVGSIFRTADGAGVDKVYLTGYTGLPVDRLGKVRLEVHKVALGAEKYVEWQQYKNISDLIKKLKKEKFFVIALEQHSKAIDYKHFNTSMYGSKDFKKASGLALIVGNEVRGLSKQILKKCDAVIEIPMYGKKESLNVSVAAGIALFSIRELVN